MTISMKRAVGSLLDHSLGRLLIYSTRKIQAAGYQSALYNMAWQRAIESSLAYANAEMPHALMFRDTQDLWDHALKRVCLPGTCVEFGVWKGRSINYFAKRLPVIYGFDSFEGLAEDWKGWAFPKGAFDLKGRMPRVAPNVRLIKGWFSDTVPEFLASSSDLFAFVHIDCDTFEAATLVLSLLKPRLRPGTVVIFDEFFGYRSWQDGGEFKAWNDFVQSTGTKFEWMGFSAQQVAIQLRER
jgi:hypothetical protein